MEEETEDSKASSVGEDEETTDIMYKVSQVVVKLDEILKIDGAM